MESPRIGKKFKMVGILVDGFKTTMYASAIIEAGFDIKDTFRHDSTHNVMVVAVPEADLDRFVKLAKTIEDHIRVKQAQNNGVKAIQKSQLRKYN